MLKIAFNLGVKLAYEEAGVDPSQPRATPAQIIGGGALGALGGGLLGRHLGGMAGEAFDLDEDTSKLVGTGLGSLLGGGLGSYIGTKIPAIKQKLFPSQPKTPQYEQGADALESLNVTPAYPNIYSTIPQYYGEDMYGAQPYYGLDSLSDYGDYGDYDW